MRWTVVAIAAAAIVTPAATASAEPAAPLPVRGNSPAR